MQEFVPIVELVAPAPSGIKRDTNMIQVRGWVRTNRTLKNICFLELNDGSCFDNLQIVIGVETQYIVHDAQRSQDLGDIRTGVSIAACGAVVTGPNGTSELHAETVELIGQVPDSYPLQKKRHSFEYLRTKAHLRTRTKTFCAVAQVRNSASMAIHEFFQKRNFLYVQTPIISPTDAEGAGTLFRVIDERAVGTETHFFGCPAYLNVSGQLHAETYASGLSRVYTFGPTFRAEHSNTARHLAEFWMVEPEIAFYTIDDIAPFASQFLQEIVAAILNTCTKEIEFFDANIEEGLFDRLQALCQTPFLHITYSEAIDALCAAQEKSDIRFEYPPRWGIDLQSEHERYLTETLYQRPTIVVDYPRDIKAFYMKQNSDNKTVRAMDILVPQIGEIIGGGEREDSHARLVERIEALGMEAEHYWWYLELRQMGSVPHAGFGLGFERFIQYITGMKNIRDVIPFPRTVGSIEF